MSKKHIVFVYGSLLSGLGNHRIIERGELLGTFVTPPRFSMYSLGAFPGVVSGGSTAVLGEVYAVDDDTLHSLDCLEGHPDFYKRTRCLNTEWGKASLYLLPDHLAPESKVVDGDWRSFLEALRG